MLIEESDCSILFSFFACLVTIAMTILLNLQNRISNKVFFHIGLFQSVSLYTGSTSKKLNKNRD